MDTFDIYDETLSQDPGKCSDCGAPHQWVRPGKTQETCECSLKCPRHGEGAIQYHTKGNPTGWFCDKCWEVDDADGITVGPRSPGEV